MSSVVGHRRSSDPALRLWLREAGSCRSSSTPGLGTSIHCMCGPEKQPPTKKSKGKKKKKKRETSRIIQQYDKLTCSVFKDPLAGLFLIQMAGLRLCWFRSHADFQPQCIASPHPGSPAPHFQFQDLSHYSFHKHSFENLLCAKLDDGDTKIDF